MSYNTINKGMLKRMSNKKTNDDKILGFGIKFWVIAAIILFSVFVGLPFLVSVYCTANNLSESFEPLVSTMDGGLIVLSVVGTVASLTSIAMTFKDRKRYYEEKEQLSDLKYLVNKISVENHALVVDLFGDDYAARIGVSDGYNKEQQEQSRWHPEENSGEIKD